MFISQPNFIGHRRKAMTLSVQEFVRRFCLHLLPARFVKIRHYGLLGNRGRQEERLARVRKCLGVVEEAALAEQEPPRGDAVTAKAPLRCPHCGALALIWIGERPPVWAAAVARSDFS